MRICYIRHAKDKVGKDVIFKGDTSLTMQGKRILKQTIEYYDKEKAVAIYTSPNKRAVQTAEIISKRYNIPVIVKEGLRERIKFDYVKGSEDEKIFWENYLNYNFQTDKFESCKTYIDRNFEVFKEIVDLHDKKDENVILVGHSATLYALNTFFNGIPRNKQIKWMQCGNCCMVKFETKPTRKV